MAQKHGRRDENDSIRVRMDLTVDLPAEVANEVERLSILRFDECVYDEESGRLKASVTTTLYRKGA